MFGINQISWGEFSGFILSMLFLWYLSVLSTAWIKQRKNGNKALFEQESFTPVQPEKFQPLHVCSENFPSELIPARLSEDILLPVSFYEETGMDEGYPTEAFSQPGNPQLPQILEQVQYNK